MQEIVRGGCWNNKRGFLTGTYREELGLDFYVPEYRRAPGAGVRLVLADGLAVKKKRHRRRQNKRGPRREHP